MTSTELMGQRTTLIMVQRILINCKFQMMREFSHVKRNMENMYKNRKVFVSFTRKAIRMDVRSKH